MALKDKLTSLASTVGGRANTAIENGKLGWKINTEEKKITEFTLHIGELMVERLDAGETFGDEVAALYASILASRDNIAAARADIEVNKQESESLRQAFFQEESVPVCPACGAPVSLDANFCSQCGAKVEVEEAPAPAEECPSCGTPVKEEDKFCPQCGTSVENAPAPEAPPSEENAE